VAQKDIGMRNLVSQIGSWMNEQQSKNLLLKVDPLSTIRNNKLNRQVEKLEAAKSRVFVSNILSLPSVKAAIYKIWVFVSCISAP